MCIRDRTAVTSYEKVVVDAITSNSESESADEDVNQISNEEVSDDAEEQLSEEEDTTDEQWQQKKIQVRPLRKGYSPPKYYSDVELKPFCLIVRNDIP